MTTQNVFIEDHAGTRSQLGPVVAQRRFYLRGSGVGACSQDSQGRKLFAASVSFPGSGHGPSCGFAAPRRELPVRSIRTHQPQEHPWFLSHYQAISASKQKLSGHAHHLGLLWPLLHGEGVGSVRREPAIPTVDPDLDRAHLQALPMAQAQHGSWVKAENQLLFHGFPRGKDVLDCPAGGGGEGVNPRPPASLSRVLCTDPDGPSPVSHRV